MPEPQHTPGPWTIGALDRVQGGETIWSENVSRHYGAPRARRLVAVCADFNRYDLDAERAANARLIAAAPDLLAALRDLLEFWTGEESMSHTRYHALCKRYEDAARAAIAKVEGHEDATTPPRT